MKKSSRVVLSISLFIFLNSIKIASSFNSKSISAESISADKKRFFSVAASLNRSDDFDEAYGPAFVKSPGVHSYGPPIPIVPTEKSPYAYGPPIPKPVYDKLECSDDSSISDL